jgi:alkanesulfonate monooxygenase SsuD/methylene tetrahydromethanopterin reductase-like flavin-dependent oxidoreductase (luciferase family)
LPIVGNPINIAEEFAMLDVLSKGRIIAGFVRGIGAEYHSTGVNPAFSHERFHEAHDLIIKAWTTVGPFEFEGNHFRNRYVNLWPRPYQTPHPPVWIPSMGSRETIDWASAPERKYPFLVTFSSEAAVVRYLNMYRETAQAHGYTAAGSQLAGPCRSMSPIPMRAPARKPGPASKRCSIIFCRCRGKCCCRPATRRMRRSKRR